MAGGTQQHETFVNSGASLPSWAASQKGKIFHRTSDDTYWMAGSSTWEQIPDAASLLNYILKSIFTAKGQVLGASASAAPGVLAPGANTHVLTADSAQALGFKWAAPSLPSGISRTVWFPAETDTLRTGYRTKPMGNGAQMEFNFIAPADFNSLTSFVLVGWPSDTFSGGEVTINSSYGAAGEAYNNHTETSGLISSYAATANQFKELDVSGEVDSLAANDYGSIQIVHGNISGETMYYLGLKMVYTT